MNGKTYDHFLLLKALHLYLFNQEY